VLSVDGRIAVEKVEVLSEDWGVLKKTTFAYRRGDGRWDRHTRETYDRGNGATILLYNRARGTVVLTRQFRLPAYVNGHPGELIEACAGLLEAEDAEDCIRREAEEETGYRIEAPRRIFEAFMSPGSVTERLAFFVAAYEPGERASAGGGVGDEDIAVVELSLDHALAMIESGEIVDGKTIMLVQYAALHGLVR
jgi:nudix-type nucleoside diphosphatase (YffH/AdpP family)